MSTISPLSPRQFQPASLPVANQQTDSKNLRTGNSSLVEKAQNDLVSLSKNGIDLQQRVESLGNSTVDLAQNLLGSFAQQLFGDSAKGATISFDAVSLDTSSSFAAGVQHSESAGGTTNAAAFSLTESSHFLGTGTITTADGRKFDFEVEVQYDYALEAAASQTTSGGPGNSEAAQAAKAARSAADPLPAVEFPDIKFPGSLQDLFRLFDKPLKSDIVQEDKQQGAQQDGAKQKLGTLSLRLLNLVNSTEALDTYGLQGDKAKAVAHAYGTQDGATPAIPAKPVVGGPAEPATPAVPAAPVKPAPDISTEPQTDGAAA
ncbi:hypothetical protein LJR289_000819 [Pseudoduganella sp. LjRoot289]|uniref:hypothetical protein n=1 Tax=Pseudoduganella sp. LjRoot289 TaxID=3342314 RepID=UPI003ECCED99